MNDQSQQQPFQQEPAEQKPLLTSDFEVGGALSEAWRKMKGIKFAVWLTAIVLIVAGFIVTVILSSITTALGIMPAELQQALTTTGQGVQAQFMATLHAGTTPDVQLYRLVERLIIFFAIAPLLAGLTMIVLKRARGEETRVSTGFNYFNRWWSVGATCFCFFLILGVISLIGAYVAAPLAMNGYGILAGLVHLVFGILSLVFFIYLEFSIYAAADKNCSPFKALGFSFQIVKNHWWQLFGLMIVTSLVFFAIGIIVVLLMLFPITIIKLLSILVGLVLLFYAYPWIHLTYGIAYHKLSQHHQ